MTEKYSEPHEMKIDTDRTYLLTIMTDRGEIELELFPEYAPKTVNNFICLAKDGYYDGIIFHRVIPNFMVQGGDPTGTGRGGPGYNFEDEFTGNPLQHETGSTLHGQRRSRYQREPVLHYPLPQSHLNGKHTVFGKVVKGQDVVDAIRQGDVMIKVSVAD